MHVAQWIALTQGGFRPDPSCLEWWTAAMGPVFHHGERGGRNVWSGHTFCEYANTEGLPSEFAFAITRGEEDRVYVGQGLQVLFCPRAGKGDPTALSVAEFGELPDELLEGIEGEPPFFSRASVAYGYADAVVFLPTGSGALSLPPYADDVLRQVVEASRRHPLWGKKPLSAGAAAYLIGESVKAETVLDALIEQMRALVEEGEGPSGDPLSGYFHANGKYQA